MYEYTAQYERATLSGKPYMIIVSVQQHIGPETFDRMRWDNSRKLSAAARKITLNENLKVTVTPEHAEARDEKSAALDKQYSSALAFCLKGNGLITKINATQAVYLMQAWDILHPAYGTTEFLNKYEQFKAVQTKVYNSLGINPQSKVRPVLSEADRQMYNSQVGPYGYDYWETHITYRDADGQNVVSKTFRSLKRPDLDGQVAKLAKISINLAKQFTVSVKTVEEAQSNDEPKRDAANPEVSSKKESTNRLKREVRNGNNTQQNPTAAKRTISKNQ